MFFFGSFRYADREVGLSRTPAQLQGPTADRGSRRSTTAATANATTPKLRAAVGKPPGLRILPARLQPGAGGIPDPFPTLRVTAFGGNGIEARLSSVWGSKTTTKVLFAYNDKSINGTFSAFDRYVPRTAAEHLQLVVYLCGAADRSGDSGGNEHSIAQCGANLEDHDPGRYPYSSRAGSALTSSGRVLRATAALE